MKNYQIRRKKNIFNIEKRVKMKIIKFDYSSYKNLNNLKLYCNKKLPNPDFAFIGIGEDGHVASIFNYKNCKENFFYVRKKKKIFEEFPYGKNVIKI